MESIIEEAMAVETDFRVNNSLKHAQCSTILAINFDLVVLSDKVQPFFDELSTFL